MLASNGPGHSLGEKMSGGGYRDKKKLFGGSKTTEYFLLVLPKQWFLLPFLFEMNSMKIFSFFLS
jgi:hypothetical protein